MKRQSNYAVPTGWLEVIVSIMACAGTVNADFTFGDLVNLGPVVNSEYDDQLPSISADGLELYFMSRRPGGVGDWDIWVARRETTHDPWEEPANLGPVVNSSGEDWAPCISADGLELYFEAKRPGGHGGTDILVTVRATTDEPWREPVNLGPVVNSSSRDGGPSISSDGLELYFKSNRPGGYGGEDLWVSERPAKGHPWGSPVNLGSTVNGPAWDRGPSISADGLLLFFGSPRIGGHGYIDLWLTSRQTKDTAWDEPLNLGPSINTVYQDDGPTVSADGRTLYFSDYYYGNVRPGGHGGADLWQVSIQPVVDFNGDGKVDGKEVLALADLWGTDDSACDIGPMPWGDGIVDLQDVIALAGFIGPTVIDPTLIAHWAFDEREGTIASDSAGDNDGAVIGTPVWHSAGGQVNGTLEFDGATCIAAEHILSPLDGPFGVLAWVKDGTAGQVVVSQTGGANWLMADALEGTLATGLAPSARNPVPPLVSDTIITDGDWHRIAFTWDGSHRRLYVDDVLVVEDREASLAECYGGLNIGCGKDMSPATFFTGLIDDVRIYNRTVTP